jgi:menaquinone-dependent protoporphyrinogen oxidase
MPSVTIDDFDAILVGGSINNRQHRPEVLEFVREHRDAITARPNGFFQVSMASAVKSEWGREGVQMFVDQLTEETGWEPDRIGRFAGAIKYPRYGRFLRLGFLAYSALSTGDTDTAREYEYTDWDEVERFAVEFGEYVEGELAGALARKRGRRLMAGGLALFAAGLAGMVFWAARRRRTPPSEPSVVPSSRPEPAVIEIESRDDDFELEYDALEPAVEPLESSERSEETDERSDSTATGEDDSSVR